MKSIEVMLVLASPWLAAIGMLWSRAPRTDEVPASMGERALERLRAL
jgi:hypothetical protein